MFTHFHVDLLAYRNNFLKERMVKEPYTRYNAPEPFNSFLVKILYCLAFSPFKIVPGSLIRSDNFLVTRTERDIEG